MLKRIQRSEHEWGVPLSKEMVLWSKQETGQRLYNIELDIVREVEAF